MGLERGGDQQFAESPPPPDRGVQQLVVAPEPAKHKLCIPWVSMVQKDACGGEDGEQNPAPGWIGGDAIEPTLSNAPTKP